jgi:hypothetical protein
VSGVSKLRVTRSIVLVALWPALVHAETPFSDRQIAEMIVRESRAAYYATGRPCACPDDLARNGSLCGGRSAYSRPGGASPYCYVSDVPKEKIGAYKAKAR